MKQAINHLKANDQRLCKVIECLGDIPFHSHNDPFSFLVGEIVGQMLSNSVRKVIVERLIKLCGGIITPYTLLQHGIDEVKSVGMSASKAYYINNLAEKVKAKEINFEELEEFDDTTVIKELKKIKGIGDWTAKMFLIFYLGRNDVLPLEDGAFLQSYKWLYNTKNIKKNCIVKRCKKWKPYSSIGARYMYVALDRGLTKIPIKDFLSK